MRLTAISEALSKPLAQKVYGQLVTLCTISDQRPMSYTEFMSYVREADVHTNMPYGNYILKIYAYLITAMEKHAKENAQRDDEILPIDLEIDETIEQISKNLKFYVSRFDNHKKRLAAAGLDTDINSYLPKPEDKNQAFSPIERALRQLGEQAETDYKTRGLPGVRLLKTELDSENKSITYRLYQITDPRSLSDIAMGFAGGDEVGWCTKSDWAAETYIASSDNYVIYRNNHPTSQFSINKVGPTASNPFAQINKIGEHKNSQNENENRSQMLKMAQTIEKERIHQLKVTMASEGLDLDAYQQMLQAVRHYLQGDLKSDAEKTVKDRYIKLRGTIQELDLPLLKQRFEQAGFDLATTAASIAGTYELGFPSQLNEVDHHIPYKLVWKEITNRLKESESLLQRSPDNGPNRQVTKAITDAIHKAQQSDVKSIRLTLTLVLMNKDIAAAI